ncbi:orotidine 5'-phosphate decarboxylase [Candidatus Jorgensenbacteria bacterium RIFCSPLOWO2_01_FULL_45_25b]|uniref:Orotidine 5'-phosphate decarboxylase n=1 Tax=Candidatus Jorgensenbacteria bacterium RIFCSPLOWO2_01_FULL_45_25b TaxID=1798471 RepID=A0A1F6BT42_9BACT|nr:MAG: orotidine 5'-phosphate decarboxylase [Candidatus Jorgensenbacteria bacterium RIFCSPLOWO2_01_FULL_45_25b]
MKERNFQQLLDARGRLGKFLCVGLDSEFSRIPLSARTDSIADSIAGFNRAIVEATKDFVCAYKPNVAFYEAYGDEGYSALRRTVLDIHTIVPDVPVILDAKRADIGSTNANYAKMAFEYIQADAITVHPYLGGEALLPFLTRAEKGVIVLCRTSNLGAGEFQDLLVNSEPLYRFVARRVASKWNKNGNCGLVVGATYPDELHEVREIVGDMPILIPGIGAQGGDLQKVVSAGRDSHGRGIILSSSRGILFASDGVDFAEAARRETEKLHTLISQYMRI